MASAGLGGFLGKLAQGFAGTHMQLAEQDRVKESEERRIGVDSHLAAIRAIGDNPDVTNRDEILNYHLGQLEGLTAGGGKGKGKKAGKDGGFSLSSVLDHFKPHFAEPAPGANMDVTADQSNGGMPRDVGVQPPVQAGGTPQVKFLTPEEKLAARIKAAQAESDIIKAREIAQEQTRGEEQRKTLAVKPSRGAAFTYNGEPIGDDSTPITEDQFGQSLVKGQDYVPVMVGQTIVGMQPVRGRVDASPLSRALVLRKAERRPEDAGKSDDDLKVDVARQLASDTQRKFQATISGIGLRNATEQERLNQLRVMDPLLKEAADLRVKAMKLSQTQKEALAKGDPKAVLAWATAIAADLATNQASEYYGQNPVDVRNGFLSRQGYDSEDLLTRSKQAPQPVVLPTTAGTIAGGKNSPPASTAKAPTEQQIKDAVIRELKASGIASPNDAQINAVLGTKGNREKIIASLTVKK